MNKGFDLRPDVFNRQRGGRDSRDFLCVLLKPKNRYEKSK